MSRCPTGTATAGSGPAPPPAPASLALPVAAAPPTVSGRRRQPSATLPRLRQAGPLKLLGRRTGSGLSLFCGIAFGGDDFVTPHSNGRVEKSLTAGGGVILGVNGMVTLLWLGRDSVGFGVGADAGIKYDDVEASNGSASITRFPIALTAHLLTNDSGGDHYFLLRGGVARDFGVHYRVSGIASIDADVDGTWGHALVGTSDPRIPSPGTCWDSSPPVTSWAPRRSAPTPLVSRWGFTTISERLFLARVDDQSLGEGGHS